ncbi:hypothetical protein ROG8370_01628 [Roseovarius gaetbuli]|uniref:von Willebrand factor type A domain protein n=2 Tax=Roseovarius gaetbuli TaxID=1356575 RepID=A0A1X6Z318_9RHOB|nr:DUF1194 domain-containing protein [Roseovarius gaetbuli]SLN39363.1 hypothetical protein ROG8370_01628 [Roseovarius gaetbuli]
MVRLAALFLALMTAGPALATCRLALVLALDVSSSVDPGEYDLQRVGLAAALDSDDVRHAILRGAPGDVALSVYEWSGNYQQKVHLDWTVLRSDADITDAVGVLAAMTRRTSDYPTALGAGLGYGAQVMARAPKCDRRVIDISGDGINNQGFGPELAYRHFPLDGITVNGLVILGHDPEVLRYYQRHVVRGPRAFAEVAQGFEDFQSAMTRKLYREVNDIVLGALAPAPAVRPQ